MALESQSNNNHHYSANTKIIYKYIRTIRKFLAVAMDRKLFLKMYIDIMVKGTFTISYLGAYELSYIL